VKPVKRLDLSRFNPEQRAAITEFLIDAQKAAPELQQMQEAAAILWAALLRSPQWRIVDGPTDDVEPPAQGWHVGAPTINYLD
jgi:hypothetical protein